ncbi:hypothetical protein TRFO_19241 [Tritrichomonas foetus]|uniref:RRM domain-containing protein n=1 Tax=Tritrichomonas foetus TaxID=1144522 RepID=A0A1J4KJG1_9EUKA|nr:hypothetical protein TRFO_19241 [Tritrichomonas foetus]|eukprot:OHT11355.1 hypothetical protein TRFO_19241 [Tritrichomonas foetus]
MNPYWGAAAPLNPPYNQPYPPPYGAVPPGYPPPYPPHAPPPPPHPKKNHVPSEQRTKVHTIFMFNLQFNLKPEELEEFCSRFGDVSELNYPLTKQGMAFCTYYDLRDAERAVKDMTGQDLKGRPVKTNFAFKPPQHSKRDLKKICANVIATSEKGEKSELTMDEIKDAIGAFGDIREIEESGPGAFLVKFYDIRHAKSCEEAKSVQIREETVNFEYALEVDLGDEVTDPPPPPPPRHSRHPKSDRGDRDERRGDRHERGRGDRHDRSSGGGYFGHGGPSRHGSRHLGGPPPPPQPYPYPYPYPQQPYPPMMGGQPGVPPPPPPQYGYPYPQPPPGYGPPPGAPGVPPNVPPPQQQPSQVSTADPQQMQPQNPQQDKPQDNSHSLAALA